MISYDTIPILLTRIFECSSWPYVDDPNAFWSFSLRIITVEFRNITLLEFKLKYNKYVF